MRHTSKGGSDIHLTPPEILDRLNRVSATWYDPCPHPWDGVDGLEKDWPVDVPWYVNPPFSDLEGWTRAAVDQWERHGTPGVLLVPCRTSQPYWTRAVRSGGTVCFWTGNTDRGGKIGRRIRFLRPDGTRQPGAPFDVALIAMGSAHFRESVSLALEDVTTRLP